MSRAMGGSNPADMPGSSPTRFDKNLLRTLFERIYVINLPEREDRRREMMVQLKRIGLADDPLVEFFPAVRPPDRGEFESVGARGCFLSHLGVLKDAEARGLRSILILEDDVDWTPAAMLPGARADALLERDWAFLHGGQGDDRAAADGVISLMPLPPDLDFSLTHFIGLRGEIIGRLVVFLEAMLGRPGGSPEGGPMHVDGAYSWFRRAHPDVAAFVCAPSVAQQRFSRSDIAETTGWRATKVGEWARGVLRPLRTMLRGR